MEEDFFKRFFSNNGFGFRYIKPPPFDRDNRHNEQYNRDDVDSFFFPNDFQQIFDEMDTFMKNLSFGNIQDRDNSRNTNAHNNDSTLRGHFLKSESDDIKRQQPKSFFENFFNIQDELSGLNNDRNKFDQDLDDKVAREGYDKVLKEDLFKQNNKQTNKPSESILPNFFSASQSTSFRRIQRPDGSIEEIKTYKNSDGKEEKIVTRIIGDKLHSVVEKKNNKNIEETEEIFQNFDEKNLDEFNKNWNNYSFFPKSIKNEFENKNVIKSKETKQNDLIEDEHAKKGSIISKIFSWFK